LSYPIGRTGIEPAFRALSACPYQ